jgi:hypothetical protein
METLKNVFMYLWKLLKMYLCIYVFMETLKNVFMYLWKLLKMYLCIYGNS